MRNWLMTLLLLAAALTVAAPQAHGAFDLAALRAYLKDASGGEVLSPAPGQRVFFAIDVECEGSGTTPIVHVETYLDNVLYDSGDLDFQGGIVRDISSDIAYAVAPGLHTLSWRVDTGNAVAETDENNNSVGVAFGGLPRLRIDPDSVRFDVSVAPGGAGRGAAMPAGAMVPAELVGRDDDPGSVPIVILLKDQSIPARSGARQAWLHSLRTLRAKNQAEVLRRLSREKLSRVRPLWMVNAIGARARPEMIERLRRLPGVRAVFIDTPMQPADDLPLEQPPVPAQTTPWGIAKIRAPEVWAMGYNGNGVTVAVLDTGVNYNHVDLINRMWRNPGEIPGNGIDDDHNGFVDDVYGADFASNDGDPKDEYGHGTCVASIVAGDGSAGTRTGVAPGARIMALRVIPAGVTELTEAIEYALTNGADVLSISAGWVDPNEWTKSSLRHVGESVMAAGVVWVAAAGNGVYGQPGSHYDLPRDIMCPADVPSPSYGSGGRSCVIAVGATDSADNLASFSSHGPTSWDVAVPYEYHDYPYPPGLMKPEVAAPGVSITVASPTNTHSYQSMGGTSASCPHVSGVIALMLSRNPYLTPAELASALEAGAVDRGSPGRDNYYGAGRVDAVAAMAAVPPPPLGKAFTIRNTGSAELLITAIVKQSGATWLSFMPTIGEYPIRLPIGAQQCIHVMANPLGLPAGVYTDRLLVYSNDPDANPYPSGVDVVLAMHDAPSIGLVNGPIYLAAVSGDHKPSFAQIDLFNAGPGTLNWTATPSAGWLAVSPAAGSSAGEPHTVVVSADPSGLSTGQYLGHILFEASGADNSPQLVEVTVQVWDAAAASGLLVGQDRTTSGSWQGTYGGDGYLLINYSGTGTDISRLPPDMTYWYTGGQQGCWSLDTTDPRALAPPNATTPRRATYRGGTAFSIHLDTPNQVEYRMAVYCVDWNTLGRAQDVGLYNPDDGYLLDIPIEVEDFAGGVYLVFRVRGSAEVRFERTAGADAVVSGIFWDRVWRLGDVTGDDCVNVADLILTRNNLGKPAAQAGRLVDVNGDGTVNVADLITVRNQLGGGCR